jgi:hypothetical protein
LKLILTNDQSKGMIGGVSFEVTARIEPSSQEAELVKHCKLDNEILFRKQIVSVWGQPTDRLIDVRVRQLVVGQACRRKSLDEVIGYSNSLKSACQTLKVYLGIASHFGGSKSSTSNSRSAAGSIRFPAEALARGAHELFGALIRRSLAGPAADLRCSPRPLVELASAAAYRRGGVTVRCTRAGSRQKG